MGLLAVVLGGPSSAGLPSGERVDVRRSAFERDGVPRPFHIKASVKGLFPGAAKDVALRVTNRSQEAIEVTSVWVRYVRTVPIRPKCPPVQFLSVTGFAGSIPVAGDSSVIVPGALSIGLDASAPDECQLAVFRVSFAGSAVPA